MKFYLIPIMAAAFVAAGSPTLVSANNLFPVDDKGSTTYYVVNVGYRNQADLQTIADNYDILGVDKQYKTANVLADAIHKSELEEEYTVTVDETATAELQASVDQVTTAAAAAAAAGESYVGIPGYSCYRTVEETYSTAVDIESNYPDLATWTDIGNSWEKENLPSGGYDIFALRLTADISNVGLGTKPVFFANCAIHAREYATAELCTRFAEMLVEGYNIDADITALLDHHEIHLILQTNPDGRKQAEAGDLWRKNTNQNYCGTTSMDRGADLNRNFPFHWGGGGASTRECADNFRGLENPKEPEVQTVLNYLNTIFPTNQRGEGENPADSDGSPDDAMGVALDIHSYSELVLYPWGDTTNPTGNADQFVTLGRKLAFYNDYTPQRSIDLYVTTGTTVDTYYGNYGVAAFVYELGTAFFQDCSTFENTILPDNLLSLMYAAKVARTPFKTPAGPDAIDLSFGASNIGDNITLTALIDDTNYNTRNGIESSQSILSASMYIDIAPWEVGATSIAMSATDGAFDANVESVTGTIDTTSLTPGRHIVYVVGTDADENEGAYSAIFLEVIGSTNPTLTPSKSPSKGPTLSPSPTLSLKPTRDPTVSPSKAPSKSPITSSPSKTPSLSPTPPPVECSLQKDGEGCRKGEECCSGLCSGGNPSTRTCLPNENGPTTPPGPTTPSPTRPPVTLSPQATACVDKLADYTPCNHKGSCNPVSEDCCSECCSNISGGNPKTCLP